MNMNEKLFLATKTGLVVAEMAEDGWRVVRRGLVGRHVTAVIAREGVILAGTTDGIFASADTGISWTEASEGLMQRHIRWLAFHPDISDYELAGTEDGKIYLSRDGGKQWQPLATALTDVYAMTLMQ